MNTFSFSKEQVRNAMYAFFLAQGLCFASWASRIPDIKEIFDVDYALYWGMVLFLIPVGKFIAIPLASLLLSRFGSKQMVQTSVLGYGLSLLFIGASQDIYTLGVCLFSFGIFWNLCDISMNTQAISIERIFGKTIIASFHGTWSLAACLGALIGYLMIVEGVSPSLHFKIIAFVILLLVLYGRRHLLSNLPAAKDDIPKEKKLNKKHYILHPEKLLMQLGLVGLFALIVESAMFDWSGVYFDSVVDAPRSMQIGFLVFMLMMTTGRFLTNAAYKLVGKKRVLQIAGMLIFLGFLTAGILGNTFESMYLRVVFTSIGFMAVGLGISCMVPTLYSFVGLKSTTPVSIAITILSSISFIGSLVAPLLIGSITQYFDMTYAYLLISLLGLAIVAMVSFTSAFEE